MQDPVSLQLFIALHHIQLGGRASSAWLCLWSAASARRLHAAHHQHRQACPPAQHNVRGNEINGQLGGRRPHDMCPRPASRPPPCNMPPRPPDHKVGDAAHQHPVQGAAAVWCDAQQRGVQLLRPVQDGLCNRIAAAAGHADHLHRLGRQGEMSSAEWGSADTQDVCSKCIINQSSGCSTQARSKRPCRAHLRLRESLMQPLPTGLPLRAWAPQGQTVEALTTSCNCAVH